MQRMDLFFEDRLIYIFNKSNVNNLHILDNRYTKLRDISIFPFPFGVPLVIIFHLNGTEVKRFSFLLGEMQHGIEIRG